MSTKNTWHTGNKPEAATHVIDDGGMIYWSVTPNLSNDEVAKAFASEYDGNPYPFDVTNLATEERSDYEG